MGAEQVEVLVPLFSCDEFIASLEFFNATPVSILVYFQNVR